ncbi:SF1B family DNA helicase RecD2 [Limosilactobacillus reuteri]|uniref:ATP-dependent RecD2 DNA helicase n=1 Tax=Limosilactobacillus reuteri subsp. rodentium (strain DSM 17509 / CIP 109821 / 100-23) TaxID=349123 RepID=B3XRJ8_LIMR1|nr:ATP-dependent RecD-like DNA helicase [Limosilactobacillus reuteri]EDX42149.1 helicase, RecD/TraA family [Limosilactobacillus reuteri subsp. rodentium]MCC4344962.1 ATP-dependent RecD-like DNA helicase [Limosilactobacillus reuteri]MCC4357159.1 ATP-dependent RecD-like DNA helicase [Limosilactobacillus reuteri]MCC4476409.1 ATP-dependent RecD-like DNA helicase [Limosilactobacillus reuteri]WJK30914.1 ATP-dependent RecD-like DNA helicase [Limosilactobacillus reuteri]
MAEEIDLFKTPTEPSFFIGQVQSEIFTSPDSFFKVLIVSVEEANFDWHEPEITVTGSFGDLSDDQTYRFEGKIVEHPRYGQQFQATSYHVNRPTSKDGLIDFLSGKQFTGIGKKTAEKIVDKLGTDAINKIIADPHVLDELKLRKTIKDSLVDNLRANQGMDQIIIGLNDLGFGANLSSAIFDKYGEETLHIINENPYQLAAEIDGISFNRADQVAQKLGIATDDSRRIDAAIIQTLDDLTMETGDTFTTTKPLLQQTIQLLAQGSGGRVSTDLIANQIVELEKNQEISYADEKIYPTALYNAEWQIADHLHRLLTVDQEKVPATTIEKTVTKVADQSGITYDQVQKEAIKTALNSKVMLLTGGPGTGKTTIIKGIVASYAKIHDLSLDVNEYKEKSFPVLLAAPTGRAAKRMSEATDLPASTIHRLLGLNGREMPTDMNARDLEGSLLIIDEMSMVDTLLFKTLIQAVPTSMHVVLVGDKDQLPSVGPGQVFHDLLDFAELPKVELTNIHRQAADSTIIPLAHAIKEGKLPPDLTNKMPDRSFISCHANQVPSVVQQIIDLSKKRDYSANDIQILAPMYRGQAGIDRLNELAQQAYNPPANGKQEVDFRGLTFRVGDKVLQLVNVPEKNIFNGDIGKITAIESGRTVGRKNESITVDFDGNEVSYSRMEWNQLRLAYCISIHKAQGSQFKMVLLPIVQQFSRMLQRNLLYTAITRAAEKLVLIGEPYAAVTSVKNEAVNRKTSLVDRLSRVWNRHGELKSKLDHQTDSLTKELASPQPVQKQTEQLINNDAQQYILTADLINSEAIDPLIGMENISLQSLHQAK